MSKNYHVWPIINDAGLTISWQVHRAYKDNAERAFGDLPAAIQYAHNHAAGGEVKVMAFSDKVAVMPQPVGKMVLSANDLISNFDLCSVPAAFNIVFSRGLDLSPLWGTLEEASALWLKILGSPLKNCVGDAMERGILPNRIRVQSNALVGFDLEGANLQGANLRTLNFKAASMRSVDLYATNLMSANFSGADLRNANISYADLCGANFTDANLDGVDFHQSGYAPRNTKWPEGFKVSEHDMHPH